MALYKSTMRGGAAQADNAALRKSTNKAMQNGCEAN